jgi:hypothetical protein
MSQSGAEIFNAIQTWIASGKCPKQFRMTATNQLHPQYEKLIDAFINGKCGGLYNSTNLDLASVFVLLDSEYRAKFAQQEHSWKAELAEREWQKRVKEVNAWVQSHPNFKQDDGALAVIKDFFTKNPSATLQDWDDFCAQHPEDSRMWVEPQALDLVSMVKSIKAHDRQDYENQLARLRSLYGAAPVQAALDELKAAVERGRQMETWRETPQDVEERRKREATELKQAQQVATDKANAKAKAMAEAVVFGFRGTSHSESFRVRDILNGIMVYKPGTGEPDWVTTTLKRVEYVANFKNKNPEVLPPAGMK